MTTVHGIWLLALSLAGLISLAAACSPVSGVPAGTALQLSFNLDPALFIIGDLRPAEADHSGSRTIAPGESWAVSKYGISGTGPGGASFSRETTKKTLSASLVPGSWEITVLALTAASKPVASARQTVLLEAGRSSSLSLVMLPVEGRGNLSVSLSSSLTPPAGSRILGSLDPVDGPAQLAGMPSLTESYTIDVEPTAPSIELDDLPAGFYTLTLALNDGAGSIAGMRETVLILAGFSTNGTCRLELGMPGVSLILDPVSFDPIDSLVLAAGHRASSLFPFQPVLAGAKSGMQLEWSLNGGPASLSTVSAPLPGTPAALPLFSNGSVIEASDLTSMARIDVLVRDPLTRQQGSTGEIYEFSRGLGNAQMVWKALYSTKVVTGASILPESPGSNPGTDTPVPVKAVVASGKPGIVLAAGFDESSSVHAFHMTAGGELFRLWKDKVTISTTKTPDRLAISPSGLLAAAAGSSNTWLRIYELDTAGKKLAAYDFTSAMPDLDGLSYVKSLAFSPDSSRLYVLANSPESIFVFRMPAVPGTAPSFEQNFSLDALYPASSLSMYGLSAAPDGSLAATSAGSSRAFLFRQNGTTLELAQTIDKALAGSDFTTPESLAFSPDSNDLYVLCGGKKVIHLRRPSPSEPYGRVGTTILPSSASDAGSIVCGGGFIAIAGGLDLAYLARNGTDGVIGAPSVLDAGGEDDFGISAAEGMALAGNGTLVLAGSKTDSSISFVEIVTP